MSWDTFWRLRKPVDHARFEAAVRAAAGSFEVQIGDESAHVLMPRAFVEKHHMNHVDLADGETFWGTIDWYEIEFHPRGEDGPYETLQCELRDVDNDPVGFVHVARTDDELIATTSGHHTYTRWNRRWSELYWPEDYDGDLPDCAGFDGKNIWAACSRYFRVRGDSLVLEEERPAEHVRIIGGYGGRAVSIGFDGLVQVRDGETWKTLPGEPLGMVYGFVAGPQGVYISAPLNLLAKIEDRVIPIDAPESVTDLLYETPAIAIAHDGAVWLAQRGWAARWDGTWRVMECDVERPIGMVAVDENLVVIGQDGSGARWNGSVWTPFRTDIERACCACVDADGFIVVGGDSRVYTLEPRGPVQQLHIRSNTSANREAWGGICEIGQAIATMLGGGPPR
jgi:hypothetical protein